jgi:hypothetical protein
MFHNSNVLRWVASFRAEAGSRRGRKNFHGRGYLARKASFGML